MKKIKQIDDSSTVVIVLAYGYKTTEDLNAYLDLVSNFVLNSIVRRIIVMGGSDIAAKPKKMGELRETIACHLYARGVVAPVCRIDAYDAASANLVAAKDLLDQSHIKADSLTIFTGHFRRFRVRLAARRIFGVWPNIIKSIFPANHQTSPESFPVSSKLQSANS